MKIPISDILKSIPGTVGIRLEPELPFTVLGEVGDLELRNYQPFTLARIKQSGTFETVQDENFRLLAEFIFGANTEDKKTNMTTPIFQDKTEDGWIMSFYIPPEHSNLIPKHTEVWMERMPEKNVAVYRYSGNNELKKMEEAKSRLLDELKRAGLTAVSHVWWAQYDQPFSVPVTKRNEVFVKIEPLS